MILKHYFKVWYSICCILATNSNTSVHQLELKWRPLLDLVYCMDLEGQ